MTARAIERQEAIIALLRRPDPPELRGRGFRYVLAGLPGADERKMQLERAYLRHRIAAAGVVEESIGAVRRYSLRIVRRKRA